MPIPKSMLLDIGGKDILKFEVMLDLLKWDEKENLFANFPIGATIQDGGKRKRSDEYDSDITLTLTLSLQK